MMSLTQFKTKTQRYGAELERWPAADRMAARALLRAGSPAARAAHRILDVARALDADIVAAFAAEDAENWVQGEQAAALERMRAGVDRRIAAMNVPRPPFWRRQGLRLRGTNTIAPGVLAIRWMGVTAGSGVLVVTGLWIGLMQPFAAPAATAPVDLLGMLQTVPLGGFAP